MAFDGCPRAAFAAGRGTRHGRQNARHAQRPGARGGGARRAGARAERARGRLALPRSECRPYHDLDLLVRDSSVAQKRLLAAGFEEVGDPSIFVDIHHERPLWLPGFPPLVIELHSLPKWVEGLRPPGFQELLADAVPSATGVQGMLAPSPAPHAVLLAVHSWAHVPMGRLGDIVDIAAVSHDVPRQELERVARSWQVERLWRTTVAALDSVVFGRKRSSAQLLWAWNLDQVRERDRPRHPPRAPALSLLGSAARPRGGRLRPCSRSRDRARRRRDLAGQARPHPQGDQERLRPAFRARPPARRRRRPQTPPMSDDRVADRPADSREVDYAVVTPVKNEESTLRTLAGVLETQVLPPSLWVVVDTGSTDETIAVAEDLASMRPWMRVERVPVAGAPARGATIVRAFHAGLKAIPSRCRFVVKLDADITMEPDHFARLLAAFHADARLGIASGTAYELDEEGVWHQRHGTGPGVWGAARMYRRACLEDVLPLEERMGWDTIDLITALCEGMETRVLLDVPLFFHQRS